MTKEIFSVWEGVYGRFKEVKGDLGVFESDHWLNRQKEKLQRALKDFESQVSYCKDYPLPIVVAMLIGKRYGGGGAKLKVFDFGGGVGLQYLDLIAKVPLAEQLVEYTILDNQRTIDTACGCMRQFENLKFLADISEGEADIVHMGSSLQYVEDWQDLLTKLNKIYKPSYFVFSDLLAGNTPSFVSSQIYFGKKIPNKFLNIEEFTGFLKGLGFQVSFRSKFMRVILNQDQIFPNHALPSSHRIDRAVNLICHRQ
ncbi:MAG: methyltransferase, TIGR04325 family [Holosporales bacterium]|jgi:putative methyltransferase (TIGR04325 family)|nr:methyltransferase, TIGR04325 family [Holosporales bacterium]